MSRSIFAVALLCSGLLTIGLVSDAILDRPLQIHDTFDARPVSIHASATNVIFSDSWATLSWEVGEGTQVVLNGKSVESTGTILQASVGDYNFIITSVEGTQSTYNLSIKAWITYTDRVIVMFGSMVITIVIGLVYIGSQRIIALYSTWQLRIRATDALASSQNVKPSVRELSAVVVLASVLHLALWLGWPPHSGADTRSYLSIYVNIFESDVLADYQLIYEHGLLPSIFHGWTLAQGLIVHIIAQTCLAATATAMVYLIAVPWGRWVARLSVFLYLLYLPLQLFFHQVSSEGVFLWCILATVLLLRYAISFKGNGFAILLGIMTGAAILTRFTGIVLLGMLLLLWLVHIGWWQKVRATLLVFIACWGVVLPWVIFRGVNYGYWAISRPPGTFVFVVTYRMGLIEPDNGPQSAYLAEIIETEILAYPGYQAAGITLDNVFHPDKSRTWLYYNDVLYVLDTKIGWWNDRNLMTSVGIEAVKSHPEEFVIGLFRALWSIATEAETSIPIPDGTHRIAPFPDGNPDGIPRYHHYSSYPSFFTLPDKQAIEWIRDRETELAALLNQRGNQAIAQSLVNFWRMTHFSPLLFLILSLIGILSTKGIGQRYIIIVFGILMVLVVGSTIVSPELRYRMPVEPILIVGAVIGVRALLLSIWNGNLQYPTSKVDGLLKLIN